MGMGPATTAVLAEMPGIFAPNKGGKRFLLTRDWLWWELHCAVCWMQQTDNLSNCLLRFSLWKALPFQHISYGLSPRCVCKINQTDLANVPSGGAGYADALVKPPDIPLRVWLLLCSHPVSCWRRISPGFLPICYQFSQPYLSPCVFKHAASATLLHLITFVSIYATHEANYTCIEGKKTSASIPADTASLQCSRVLIRSSELLEYSDIWEIFTVNP